MIDAHVHLENGPLSKEYVYQFIRNAQVKGIDHLQILDHTHRFYEFKDMYDDICRQNPLQAQWFSQKQKNSLQDYIDLIEEIKKEDLPIKVTWGLEVCYKKEREPFLKDKLNLYPFDFLVGSVHSIFDILYDISSFSKELLWDRYDTQTIFQDYYRQLEQCIGSDLFSQIGHPDVIKLYQKQAGYDLTATYETIADLAKTHNVLMEDNTGAFYRYHHPQVGLDPKFRKILQKKHVPIVWASDAHIPEHVGQCFDKLKKVYE